jgi:hypothetical protein
MVFEYATGIFDLIGIGTDMAIPMLPPVVDGKSPQIRVAPTLAVAMLLLR